MKHRVVGALLGTLLAGLPLAGLSLGGATPSVASAGAAASADAAAPPRLSPEARERIAAAVAAYQAGDWKTAAQGLADVGTAAAPIREYTLYLEGTSLSQLGDAAGARAASERALERAGDGPLLPAALLLAAREASTAGDEAAAARWLRRFVDRFADRAEAPAARLALGQSLEATGARAEALGVYRALWLGAPASREAERAAERQKALADAGVVAPPPTPKERLQRAERLLASGESTVARAEAEALLAESPPADVAPGAWRVVVEAARRAGKSDEALRAVDRALAASPAERRAPWLMERARLLQARTPDQALAALDRVAREHPRSPDAPAALLGRAQILDKVGPPADAAAAYQRVVADYPDSDEAGSALWRLGWIAWFRGALPEAAQRWTRLATIRAGERMRDMTGYWTGRALADRDAAGASRHWRAIAGEAPRSYYGILAAARLARSSAGTAPAPTAASTAGAGATAGAPSPAPPAPASAAAPTAGAVATPATAAIAPALPAEPLEAVQEDARYLKAAALRSVGLAEWADGELWELARRSSGDAPRLYAVSAAFADEARHHLALRILRRDFFLTARAGHELVPRRFWEMFYPIGWRAELTSAATRTGLDPLFVAAVVREESSYDPRARSRVGARGLMQLMPDTARPLARAQGLTFREGELLDDPGANLEMGTTYIAQLVRDFGEPRVAVAAYNAGPRRAREWWAARLSDDVEVWVEQIPFNETRAFVKRVMLSWAEYRRLYAPAP